MKRVVEHTATKFGVFFPPSPPWYELRPDGPGAWYLHSTWTETMLPGHTQPKYKAFKLPTKRHQTIAAVYVPAPKQVSATLLWSHGNAMDIGQLTETFRLLSRELQINILGYDYSGYGCSSGEPAVGHTYADLDACYAWLLEAKGISPSDVILYGQSVGSGPTVDLAARTAGLGGVILHSPLLSGMQVLKPCWRWWPSGLDIYPNASLMPKITAPCLVMHGRDDNVVPFSHGQTLHGLLQRPYEPWWVEGKGHQDLETHAQYLPTLRKFVQACRQSPLSPLQG